MVVKSPMLSRLKQHARHALCRTGYRPVVSHLLPRYEYNFTPAQLQLLCGCLDATEHLAGAALEIGVASGQTTIYLNTHLRSKGAFRPYLCVDTFAGFTKDDVDFEIQFRGKAAHRYHTAWKDWSKELFEHTMAYNGFGHVAVVQADINQWDVAAAGPLSFCLVDVDLYLPVLCALRKVHQAMPSGGIIVVDDCSPGNKYDGALHAYQEFVAEQKLPEDLRLGKLGVIHVP